MATTSMQDCISRDVSLTIPANRQVTFSFLAAGATPLATNGSQGTNSSGDPNPTVAFTAVERDVVRSALSAIERYINVTFVEVSGTSTFTFGMEQLTDALGFAKSPGVTGAGYCGLDTGQSASGTWNGSDFYQTVVHEIGHLLGLAHPHDDGGGSDIYSGIGLVDDGTGTGTLEPDSSDRGDFDLNQGINTMMSYNTGWRTAPGGATADDARGAETGPMAFDIAVLQAKYGARTANVGTREYVMGDSTVSVGGFTCLYSTSGQETIRYGGNRDDSIIDLNAAPLGYQANAGGPVSTTGTANLDSNGRPISMADVGWIGYTIANGTVIENAIGGARHDILIGNGVSNTLEGREDIDSIYGNGGNDTILGGAGGDYMDGGDGIDTLSYRDAQQRVSVDLSLGKVVGSDGNSGDTIVRFEDIEGSNYNDDLRGDAAKNVIYGRGGADRIDGGGGDDILKGGGGDDFLQGGSGPDGFYGDGLDSDTGFDTVSYIGEGAVVADLLDDSLNAGAAAGDFYVGIEALIGTANADTLRGDNFNNLLEGRAGGDAYDGRGGSDTVSYAASAQGVAADIGLGKYLYGDAQGDTMTSIENLTGSAYNDDLRGDANANILQGLGGNDTLIGQGGADQMFGGLGNDTYYVDTDFDQVREAVGGGSDTVLASATYRLHQQFAEVEVLRTTDAALTTAIDLYGSDHSNTIIGNAGANRLDGRGGNDFLYTGAGADIMEGGAGGAGYDTIVFHKAMVADWQSGVLDADIASDSWSNWDAIWGSSGADRIRTNSWGYAVELRGGAGADVLATGVTGVVADALRGEAGNDELNGGAGGDYLDGGTEADIMFGMAGNDTYRVDNAGDRADESLLGSNGLDTVSSLVSFSLSNAAQARGDIENLVLGSSAANGTGNSLANSITGSTNANTLIGASGNDSLSGGGGDDRLIGDQGVDQLYGGANNDLFYFRSLTDSGAASGLRDVVRDFTAGDRLAVHIIDANGIAAGDQAFTLDNNNNFAIGEIGQQRLAGNYLLLRFNTDLDSAAEMEVLLANRATFLSAADFAL